MSEKPLVSILINTYNQSQFFNTLIEGLESQTYQNFEALFIDDGSTDGTQKLIFDYCSLKNLSDLSNFVGQEKQYIKNRFYCPHFNEGFFGVLKAGIKALTPSGKYIKILEGDDYYLPEQLEKEVSFLEEHDDFVAVHSDTNFLFPGNSMEERHWAKNGRHSLAGTFYDYIPSGFIFNDLVQSNFIMTCSFTCRREALEWYKFDLFKERGYKMGDWPWFLGLARNHKIGYIDEALAVYRSGFGQSHNPEKRQAFVESSFQIQKDALIGKL